MDGRILETFEPKSDHAEQPRATSDSPRSTVFNLLKGLTERFFTSLGRFLRNNPLSSKLYTPYGTFRLCKITTANDILKMAPSGPALSIVQYVGN